MTEQEIINYLKENKNKGVIYLFMPKEVQNWLCINYKNPKLLYLTQKGEWKSFFKFFNDHNNVVGFSLPDDYEAKEKSKGGWVEFEIDEEGDFCDKYAWWDWNEFLSKAKSYQCVKYTAFGGWQYESNGYWLTEPHVIGKEGLLTTLTNYNDDCRPAIPIKIRFWREIK